MRDGAGQGLNRSVTDELQSLLGCAALANSSITSVFFSSIFGLQQLISAPVLAPYEAVWAAFQIFLRDFYLLSLHP